MTTFSSITSPTLIVLLCQIPTILWNVLDYWVPPITVPKKDRRQAAIILLYFFKKATHQLNGMWGQGIDSYLQSHLSQFYQRQFEKSIFSSYLAFYASYVGKFSIITRRWYQETDNDLPCDWNNRGWISQQKIKVVLRWSPITDQELIELVQGCPCIQNINLCDTTITDKGLTALAQWCPNLRKICLNSCQTITDKGLITLAQGCPNIIYLDLNSTNITDRGLIKLAQECPNIIYLDLSSTNITDQGLITLAQYFPIIRDIKLYGCKAITKMGINYLANWYPDIRIHRIRTHHMYCEFKKTKIYR